MKWIETCVAGWIVVAAPSCSSDSDATPTGCSSEADCRSDQECVAGKCVDLSADAGTDGAGGAGGGDSGTEASSGCIGKQGTPTAGLPCGCAADCDPQDICADELATGFPGGRCVRGCSTEACPGDLICQELVTGDPSTRTCFLPCTTTDDCPPAGVCQTVRPDAPLTCSTYCQDDADCPVLGTCDRYTGVCGDKGMSVGDGDIGDPCTADSDCRSDFCLPAGVFADGYCTAFCTLSRDGCPEGSACTPNWSDVGDTGLCFRRCVEDMDCRTGYQCGFYDAEQTFVCGPL